MVPRLEAGENAADDKSVSPFQYASLGDTLSNFRLIKVLPGTHGRVIQCTIEDAKVSASYIALSYNWGTADVSKTILMNGRPCTVRRNLFNFLLCAQVNFPGQAFWIDALSINQQNIAEKNHQVRLMAKIYKNASAVLLWLDSEDAKQCHGAKDQAEKLKDFRKEAVTAIRMLRSDSHAQAMQAYRALESLSSLIQEVKHHPYWTRLWVVQEILLGRCKTILYKNYRLPWELFTIFDKAVGTNTIPLVHTTVDGQDVLTDFVIPLHLFDSNLGRRTFAAFAVLRRLMRIVPPNEMTCRTCNFLLKILATQEDRVYFRGRGLRSLADQSIFGWNIYAPLQRAPSLMPGYIPLLDLIATFIHAKCSDPRDKIYGLLSICKERSVFHPNYQLNVYELFFKTVEYATIDALQSNELAGTRRMSMSLSKIVQTLMFTLSLGPYDMLLCDDSGRTLIVTLQSLQRRNSHWKHPTCRIYCQRCRTAFWIRTVNFGAQKNAVLICFEGLGYYTDKQSAHVIFHRDEVFRVHLTSGANELAELYNQLAVNSFMNSHIPTRTSHMGSLLDSSNIRAIDIADLQVNCGNRVLPDSEIWEATADLRTNPLGRASLKHKACCKRIKQLVRKLRAERDGNRCNSLWHQILPFLEFEKDAWQRFISLIRHQYPSFQWDRKRLDLANDRTSLKSHSLHLKK